MTERKNPGRPRKWASDAERMRARRAAQRADREMYAEAGRARVLPAPRRPIPPRPLVEQPPCRTPKVCTTSNNSSNS